tara:strand:+ start:35 stop:487 length:453 start_codon:yes stop_codon:yes gene_type:complete
MAIARGAGTEIIRTVQLEALVGSAEEELIFGVQHHIYTVLSVIVHANTLNAAGDYFHLYVKGYDALGGATAQNLNIAHQEMTVQQTFVWNDKFSFMGHEPVDFTAGMDSAAKQDAVADQGSAVVQKLLIYAEHASDNFDVTCTYIDQNNA